MTDPVSADTVEQRDQGGGASDWALFRDDYWLKGPTFAAQIVKKTAKMVTYRAYRRTRDGEEYSQMARLARHILVEGLTRSQAERAAQLDASSVALWEQEEKAAKQRHENRRAEIVAKARQP